MLNADMTTIVLREDSTAQPFIVSTQNGGSENLVGRRFEAGTGISEHIFEAKKPMRLQNYHAWQNQSPAFGDIKIAAIVGVPLLYDDNVLGALIACELKPGRTFSDRDEAMLEMLAPQAAVAIMNAQLRQRVAALSTGNPGSQPA
jgi:GAF domain-containing protein